MKSKFFCDIEGTYDGGKNRSASIQEFVMLLNNLDNNDELNFSFITSDDVSFVKKAISEFEKHTQSTKIKFGKQYTSDKMINNDKIEETVLGKCSQMCVDLSSESYDKVYYAEDGKSLIAIAEMLLTKRFPNTELVIFKTENGIESLNAALSKHINEKNKSK